MQPKSKKQTKQNNNHLEAINELISSGPKKVAMDIGKSTISSIKTDVFQGIGKDVFDQVFGGTSSSSYSSEIKIGETVSIGQEKQKKESKDGSVITQSEFQLIQMEKELVSSKSNELRLELKAIQEEILTITQNTQKFSAELRVAAMQAPTREGVGIYHLVSLRKFLDFLKSYGLRIEKAAIWMARQNKRADQKGWVANYKAHGAKYLLSGEHYIARSAG